MRTRLSDYTRTEKAIASLLIVVFSFFSLHATFASETPFTRYSDILEARGIINTSYDSTSRYATRVETLRIAVGLGGWPSGCSATPSSSCDIESIARSRGLVPSGFDNVNLGIVIRANAIRLSLQARGIGPSLAPSGFRDVDGKLSSAYAGYISKAREIGCIQTAELFRPFDPVTEGEYAKMAVCSLEDSEDSLSAAPSQIAGQYGAVPLSNVFTPSTPSGGSFPSGGNGNYALKSELDALRTLVYALSGGVSHLPVSLSTANGLSLSGQELSFGIASGTTTGALMPSDWSVFYSKENPLAFTLGLTRIGNTVSLVTGIDGQVLAMSGGLPTWVVPGAATAPVLSVYGRLGAITAQTGDYNSDQVTEGSTNLYFTQIRAQDALSGTIAGINTNISTLSSSLTALTNNYNTLVITVNTLTGQTAANTADINTLSGGLSILSSSINTLSGNLSTLNLTVSALSATTLNNTNAINSLSGTVASLGSTITTISGSVATLTTSVNILTSDVSTLSGQIATNTSDITSLSGSLATLSGAVSTLQSQIASLGSQAHDAVTLGSANGLSLSGQQISLLLASATTTGALSATDWNTFSSKISLTSLSAVGPIGYDNSTGVFTLIPGTNGQILSVSGGLATWVDPAVVSLPVTSVFGRAGAVTAQAGDYNTMLVTESGSNLYFTDVRAQNALSGTISGLQADINSLSGSLASLTSSVASLSGVVAANSADISTLSGGLASTNTTLSNLTTTVNTLSGNLTTLSTEVSTLSGTVATNSISISTLSGYLSNLTTTVNTLSGSIATLSGNVATLASTVSSLSGIVAGNSADISTLSGQTATNTANISTLSGIVATNSSNITSLSGALATTNTNLATLSGSVATLASQVASLAGLSHDAVTLGTANGLSLSGQELSLALASATTTGALSIADYNAFSSALSQSALNTADIASLSGILASLSSQVTMNTSSISTLSGQTAANNASIIQNTADISTLSGTLVNKIGFADLSATGGVSYNNLTGQFGDLFTFNSGLSRVGNTVGITTGVDGHILAMSGGVVTWVAPGAATSPVSSVFGRLGAVTAQSGDYNSDQVTEGSTNLYFTDVRAQNALSGTIAGINSNISTLSGTINSLASTVDTLSGSLATLSSTVTSLSGVVTQNSASITTLSGQTATNTANISQNTANITSLSGTLATTNAIISSLSGVVSALSTTVDTLSGELNSLESTVSTLSGTVATNSSNITSLSGALATLSNTVSALSGSVDAVIAGLSSLSGTLSTTNTNLTNLTSTVGTLSGQVTTNTTNISSLSGALALTNVSLSNLTAIVTSLSGALGSLQSVVSQNTNDISTLSGQTATNTANISALSGQTATNTSNITTLSGQTATNTDGIVQNSADISTLSGALASLASDVSILQSQITSLLTQTHDAVTIGVGNGLSLSGQQISLLLASATTTGALSATDWNTFSAKENVLTFNNGLTRIGDTIGLTNGTNGQILSMVGGVPTWVAPASVSVPVDSVFGRTGDILALAGDYNTMLVTESGSNLYFTEIRAQNALSGTVATLSGEIATNTSSIATLSGILAIANADIATLSGNLATTNTNLTNLSGTVNTLSGRVTTLSGTVDTVITDLNTTNANLATATGNIATLTSNLATATGNIATLSGQTATNTANITTLSGQTATNTSNITTLSGQTATNTSNITTLSGIVAGNSADISTLSGQVATLASDAALISASLTTLSGTVAQHTSDISTLSGQTATNTSDITTLSGALASLASSAGSLSGSLATLTASVETLSGQTATNTNNISTLSGSLATLTTTVDTLSGSLANLTTVVDTLSGQTQANTSNIATNTADIASLSGALVTLNNTVNSLSGTVSTLSSSVDSLSGALATTNSNLSTLSGSLGTTNANLASLSGTVSTLTTTVDTLSGQVATLIDKMHDAVTLGTANGLSLSGQELSLALASATTTGALSAMDFAAFSGKQNALTLTTLGNNGASTWTPSTSTLNIPTYTLGGLGGISLTSLSATAPLSYDNTTGIFSILQANSTTNGYLSSSDWLAFSGKENVLTFNNGLSRVGNTIGLTNGSNGEVLTMIGGIPTWAVPGATSSPVTSVFGRTGAIIAQSGDYTTTQVTEGTNLYFTNARAIGATLTGFSAFSGTVTASDTILQALQKLQGSNTLQDSAITTLSGLSHDAVTLGTANGLSLAGQQISLALASTSTTGALSITDFNTFSGKLNLTSLLNGFVAGSGTVTAADTILGAFQKLQGTNTAQDAIIATKIGLTALSATGGISYNSGTGLFSDLFTFTGGLLRSGNQVIISGLSGDAFNTFASGQIFFGSASGGFAQTGAFYWDSVNIRLGIGTSTPSAKLDISDPLTTTGVVAKITAPSITGTGYALQITGTGGRNLIRVFQNGSDPLDVERVTIGQGGISAGKPDALGERDQLYVYGRINSSWDMAWFDFLGGNIANITTDTNLTDGITYDVLGTAPYNITTFAGNSGVGTVAVNGGATNGGIFGSAGGTPTERSLNPVLEARMSLSTLTTVRAIAGFANRALNTGITADVNNYTNEAMFRKTSAGTTWTAVTRSGGGAELVTVLAQAPTTMAILRVELDDTAAAARFYVDGTLVATHTGASVPASATALGYHVGVQNGGGSPLTGYFDYIRVWSDDPPGAKVISTTSVTDTFLSVFDSRKANTFASKSFLQEMNSLFQDVKDPLIISSGSNFEDKGEYTKEEYAEYALGFTKKSLEKMSGTRINTDLRFDSLSASGISTDKLCVRDTCIEDLFDFLRKVDANIGEGEPESMTPLEQQIKILEASITHTQNQIQQLESIRTTMALVATTGSTLPDEDITALSYIRGATEALFIEFHTVFTDLVTFTREVVFESIVTFKDRVFFEARVAFSDPDMAGVATIVTETNRVRVEFETPYSITPIVTISPVDHYEPGTVKNLTTTGFDIEVSSSASGPLKFNWIALLVTTARDTTSTVPVPVTPPTEPTEPESPPSDPVDPVTSSGTETPVETASGSTGSGESLPREDITEESPTGTTTDTEVTPPEEESPPIEALEESSTEPTTETPPVTTPSETVSGEV